MVDQDVMKGPQAKQDAPTTKSPKYDQESKLSRVKRILTNTLTINTRSPSTFDEAKASCKARKRKERQESVSSISQERKVIRSNSEERPSPTELKNDIRRVSSHENFQCNPANEVESLPSKEEKNRSPHRDQTYNTLMYDDCEHEKRRSNERFSKPLTQKVRSRTAGKKPKTKRFSKSKYKSDGYMVKEYEIPKSLAFYKSEDVENVDETDKNEQEINNFLKLHKIDKERSPSPVRTPISPALDLTTLHEQIDFSEPIPSNAACQLSGDTETLPSLSVASNRLLSSPRNSIMITRRIYLDPDVPLNNTALSKETKSPLEQRLKQLSKQINKMKKKIKKQEEEFEMQFGFKPSHADKLCDKNIKKLYADLGKFKKEYKQLKEDFNGVSVSNSICQINDKDESKENKKQSAEIQDTLNDIEKHLQVKRKASERNDEIDKMSSEELIEEKIAVQKALLHLESIHGRPSNKEDRDCVRPLYDRYRTLKRLVSKITTTHNSNNELATIHEHETMDFVSTTTTITEIECEGSISAQLSTDSDTDTSVSENLHSLNREELLEQLKIVSEDKKQLRRTLKQFETEFQVQNGRKLQKDDKIPMENVYAAYKKNKAKLRLIDALLGKQIR